MLFTLRAMAVGSRVEGGEFEAERTESTPGHEMRSKENGHRQLQRRWGVWFSAQ